MKRFIAGLLVVIIVISLTACSGGGNSGKSDGEKPTIVYLANTLTDVFCYNISVSLETMKETYNYNLIAGDSGSDNGKFVELIETYCDQKVDGIIVNAREEISERILDLTTAAGIPCVSESTNLISADTGELLTPGVELNAYDCGAQCAQWIGESYADYGFDVSDMNQVGFMVVLFSPVISFTNRGAGAVDTFKAYFPDLVESNIFYCDTLGQENFISAEAAYNEAAAILAGNAHIKTWFVVGVLDPMAQGAVRAIEAAGLEETSLVSSVGGESLVQEWDSGYEGCWKACAYFEAMDFMKALVPELMSVINGDAKLEDLFPDWKEEGAKYGAAKISGDIATIETYKDVRAAHSG